MRRNFTRTAAMGLAAMLGLGSMAPANAKLTSEVNTTASAPIKATAERKKTTTRKIVNPIGGMDFTRVMPDYGMSPKEYGMRYGNGGSKRSNKLRYSHNAKLKRRMGK